MDTLKKQQLSPMDLPTELLRGILLRLPVKSVFRFKCVSKQWLSLLSDSHFAKSHFDLTNNINNKLLYLSRDLSGDYSNAYRVKIAGTSIHHDYRVHLHAICKHESTRIIGSCRGFILLKNDTMLILWNPVTDFYTAVAYPDLDFWNLDFPCSSFFCGGVGYENSTDDYLIVIGSIKAMLKPWWKFFSLRTNSWKEIEGGDRFFPCFPLHRQLGLVYNEAIHWLAIHTGSDDEHSFVIVAFDIATKTLSMFPLPYPQDTRNCELSLMGGGGCFGMWIMNNTAPEIWVMKEYKVESSWTKLNIVLPLYRGVIPLCFADSGDEVVCRRGNNRELMKLSNNQAWGRCVLNPCDNDPILVMFTESLLSLPSSK
ncbi:hypothetical protein HN51_067906 [Arachis hypogaea]|uniref:F-box domain-containing protein n=1 Tax=Arachis hypogaea TaxID=3818 RepID=A0A444WN06_ARAHY|nr:F-box/kelch-repeat protein At3g23880 [Arachis hypogaea]QHO09397.1 F-box/kelch-repeat protein [Arachis hypogaea]RYQ78914.1 hypothetical protein Ahy_Scaffold8g108390 [Arachis hypogaea]